MDCLDCEQLFMKYMDNELTEKEAIELRQHLDVCAKCMEEFIVYDKILMDFTNLDLVEAPENFEVNVMDKINLLPNINEKVVSLKENAFHIVWVVISALVGISVFLLVYKDQIVSYLSSSKLFSDIITAFKPISDFAQTILLDLTTQFTNSLTFANGLLADFRLYIVLAIIATGIIISVTSKFIKQK